MRFYFFYFIIFFFFLKNIYLDSGNMQSFLNTLPYFSLYCYLISIYKFILLKFKSDFDILIMEKYYKHIKYDMERDEEKKKYYIEFLLYNKSEFKFEDSSFYFLNEKMNDNIILIETYKYTKNHYPNDFFTRIKKTKPIFPNK